MIKESPDPDLLDLAETLATSCVSASVCWFVVTDTLCVINEVLSFYNSSLVTELKLSQKKIWKGEMPRSTPLLRNYLNLGGNTHVNKVVAQFFIKPWVSRTHPFTIWIYVLSLLGAASMAKQVRVTLTILN